MKITNVYIGGWFQRTMLQLSEVYDFLREGTSRLDLKPQKLAEFRKNLEIGKLDYGVAGQEYLEFTTPLNISIKIFEDGLTKNEFIRTLKRVFKSKLHCIWLIDDKFGNVAVNVTPSNQNDMFI